MCVSDLKVRDVNQADLELTEIYLPVPLVLAVVYHCSVTQNEYPFQPILGQLYGHGELNSKAKTVLSESENHTHVRLVRRPVVTTHSKYRGPASSIASRGTTAHCRSQGLSCLGWFKEL